MDATGLWASGERRLWQAAADRYAAVIAAQGVVRLQALDDWYRGEFPDVIARRRPRFVTSDELIRVTEWKMARGVWRQRNLLLVRSNAADLVEQTSREALSLVPDPVAPIVLLSRLAGVGPATASAVAAAAAAEVYPFFDELVAAQAPGLGAVAFTVPYYRRYAEVLRARADALGNGWTPTLVERALWSHAGGKAGVGQPGR